MEKGKEYNYRNSWLSDKNIKDVNITGNCLEDNYRKPVFCKDKWTEKKWLSKLFSVQVVHRMQTVYTEDVSQHDQHDQLNTWIYHFIT